MRAVTSPDFSITTYGSPDHPVLHIAGELGHDNGLALIERVQTLLGNQPSRLSLELSQVSFFGSGSVSALVSAHLAADETGTDLHLMNVPPNLHRLLDLSGVLSLFRIETAAADGH